MTAGPWNNPLALWTLPALLHLQPCKLRVLYGPAACSCIGETSASMRESSDLAGYCRVFCWRHMVSSTGESCCHCQKLLSIDTPADSNA